MPAEQNRDGLESAIAALHDLSEQAVALAKEGQVVETDLLTMRIGIVTDALRHSDRSQSRILLPRLTALFERLGELSAILTEQQSHLQAEIGERARRALDAYR